MFCRLHLSGQLLDRLTYQFALTSSCLRRFEPFRRLHSRAKDRGLYSHPLTPFMLVWIYDYLNEDRYGSGPAQVRGPYSSAAAASDFEPNAGRQESRRPSRGYNSAAEEEQEWQRVVKACPNGYCTYAASFRYHPPREVCMQAWTSPPSGCAYYAIVGHGPKSCPELCSVTEGERGVCVNNRPGLICCFVS